MNSLQPADHERLATGLSRAARFGTYFEADLAAAPGEPLDVAAAVDAMARRLGTGEARVAASYLQYETAERAWSLALGAWAFTRALPDFAHLRLILAPDGSVGVGFTELQGWTCLGEPAENVAEVLARNVIDGVLVEFHDALHRSVKIADGLLWGNAAAALVISARSAGRARSCVDVAGAVLSRPPLAGRLDESLSGSFRRRSCCLYYRAAAGSKCADCPLIDQPA
jgi:hypothetical protein